MVFNAENSENSEDWTEIVSRKMSGDMKSDNASSGQESRERDKNVSEEFFNLENEQEKHFETEKCSDFSVFSCSEDFKCNNFASENDSLKHFEESYEHQYYLKLSESEVEQEVSDTIRLWLDNMDKKLDYIYNYQIQEEYYSEEEDGEEYEFESEEKGKDDN